MAEPLDLLVVDDDEGMRALLNTVLVQDGHAVSTAGDGQQALELTRAKRFDLVVTDVQLPIMTGLELFAKLRAEAPNTDVIVMTADAALKDAVTALREGAADYLVKPFELAELRLRIKRIAERVHLARALDKARAALSERIGSYKLEEQIGEGAMGIVYKASHVMLRRPTAIKLLLRATQIAISRFEREVQLTCRLTHPNTIAIYDYGRTPDGVFFYAMELLNGASLAQVVRGHGAFRAGRVLRVLDHLCGSLMEAHSQGLIHRDVKPSNIQLCERGGVFDTTKLLDFGLVKEVSGDDVNATQEHVILGTPAYLAPEIIRDGSATSPAQDIYALGMVAYQMLAGRPAFSAQKPMDIYLQHLNARPPPFRAKVPKKLDALVRACLEKRPQDRPRSAQALRVEIIKLREQHPWDDDDACRWWKTHDVRVEAREAGVRTESNTSPSRRRRSRAAGTSRRRR